MKGHIEIVKLLLAKGAQTDKAADNGATPLIIASMMGHIEIVKLLLANGANVNVNTFYYSALGIAKKKGHNQIAELLKEHGAKDEGVSDKEKMEAARKRTVERGTNRVRLKD